jgi:hypothetical protein
MPTLVHKPAGNPWILLFSAILQLKGKNVNRIIKKMRCYPKKKKKPKDLTVGYFLHHFFCQKNDPQVGLSI